MINEKFNHRKAIYALSVTCILFTASGLHAEERRSAAKVLSEGTKEYLSDRARTGSLIGSIIAGAAVANPLAPLIGSVAGFIIGKKSAYSDKGNSAAQRQAYNNRSLVPSEDGLQITGLAGLTGKPTLAAAQPVILGLPGETGGGYQLEQTDQKLLVGMSEETGTGYQSERPEEIIIVGASGETGVENQSGQTQQIATMGLTGNTGELSNLPEQLAHACSNVQPTQQLSLGCYYYSQ